MRDGAPSRRSRLVLPDPRWGDPPSPDAAAVEALVRELRLPPVVCSVLAGRGLTQPEAAKRFLRPELELLLDARSMADATAAARRLVAAIDAQETILVHGDYDVDGICAAALYARWLRRLGGSVVPFVPHRVRDGYDFGEGGVREALRVGAGVVLTADCGTSAVEAVGRVRDAGMDVVVTDHHTVGDDPAPATFLVNPQRPDCPYPEKSLCGTGVAFKLCQLVAEEAGADPRGVFDYLDLVALATVADLVPLQGENRILVRYGLRRFADTRIEGLRALLAEADVAPDDVTTGSLGYRVAPRINAAGRIGEAADGLRLLLTDDPEEARRLAQRLDRDNQDRQEEDRRILDEAVEHLEATFDPERDFGVVLASEGWHPGVIGIVASRVVERIHRPAVLLSLDGDGARGSARSVPGFHLYEAVAACASHLRRFGGHRQAAGMDLDRAAVPAFREAFNREARRRLAPEDLRPRLRTDVELPLEDADLDLVHWLGYLAPHGIGNPTPVFMARGVEVERPKVVGGGHLKARIRARGCPPVDAIGFGLAERHPPDSLRDGRFDVLLKLERNEWRGTTRVQARLLALRPEGAA